MYGDGDPLVGLLLLLGSAAFAAYERIEDWRTPDEGSVEHLHQLYRDGKIDERELEQRLEIALDPRTEEIRSAVERVSGIGPGKSAEVAAAFESVDDLRDADQEDLKDVAGVGPQLADAIQERV
jgi:ERCC4-type nuclease